MNQLNRSRVLSFIIISLIVIAVLSFGSYQWQRIHYREPVAAFYHLAAVMEQEDKAALVRLAPRGVAAELQTLAKPYGGIQHMGKILRESPEVTSFIHVPFTSMEVIARVKNKRLLILFLRRRDGYVATTAFFAD